MKVIKYVFCTNLLSSISSASFLSHQTREALDIEAQMGQKLITGYMLKFNYIENDLIENVKL